MARIAYFDCPSGAAGDMIMGALVDGGAPFEALRDGLHGLDLTGWDLVRHEVRRGDFRATKVDVEIDGVADQDHGTLGDIVDILERSRLRAQLRDRARLIFERLADAEARVHGTTRERVHFHDVGAVDAIVDVTGGVLGLHLLRVETVYVSPLPLGGGFSDGPHGRMPIPGPGTAELLRGFPVVDTGVRVELVTPTGAAILTTLAKPALRPPRHGPHRALRTRAGGGAEPRPFRGVFDDRRALVGVAARGATARDRHAGHQLRADPVQGLAARGARCHGDAGIRRRRPHRQGEGAARPRGAGPGARGGPPAPVSLNAPIGRPSPSLTDNRTV